MGVVGEEQRQKKRPHLLWAQGLWAQAASFTAPQGRTRGQGVGQGVAEDHSHTPPHRGRARRGYEERLTVAAVEAGRDPWQEGGRHDSKL